MDKLFQVLHINLDKAGFNKLGLGAASILVQDIVAAVCVLSLLVNNKSFIAIAVVATVTMIANAMAIAQQPIKMLLTSSIVSLIVSCLVLIYCFI